jgi:hypothetical protein
VYSKCGMNLRVNTRSGVRLSENWSVDLRVLGLGQVWSKDQPDSLEFITGAYFVHRNHSSIPRLCFLLKRVWWATRQVDATGARDLYESTHLNHDVDAHENLRCAETDLVQNTNLSQSANRPRYRK